MNNSQKQIKNFTNRQKKGQTKEMKCFLDYSNGTANPPPDDDIKVLKCIFLGEPNAGKTSILSSLAEEIFLRNREPTIGIDFRSLHAIGVSPKSSSSSGGCLMEDNMEQSHYKLQLWDCAGQIRFRSIVKSYYRLAQLVFVVFDLTDYASYQSIDGWVKDIKENIPHPFVMVLLANKKDLLSDPEFNQCVPTAQIQAHAQDLGFYAYREVSAMQGDGLEDAINTGLSRVHELVMNGVIKIDTAIPGTVKLRGSVTAADAEHTKCFGGCFN